LLYIPEGLAGDTGLPLTVQLHGAGGDASHALDMLRPLATQHGFAILAPASRDQTWDLIMGGLGPDVAAIDLCLEQVFKRVRVRPDKLAISGFSDGASYALSLGIGNGDLFRHILAFSPGFAAPASQQGRPRIFVSHGSRDTVLPIDRCSRRLVPQLRSAGYEVEYREFDGGHSVPADMREGAVAWWGVTPPAAQK
jgi:predicted esterase